MQGDIFRFNFTLNHDCQSKRQWEGFRSKLDYHFFRDVMDGNLQLAESWTGHPLNIPVSPKIPICVILLV